MARQLRNLLVTAGLLLLIYFTISFMASLSQLADTVDRFVPGWGTPFFVLLAGLMLLLLLVPVVLIATLPKTLVPPEEPRGAAYDAYSEQLKRRLRTNPHLNQMPIDSEQDLQTAISKLDQLADEESKKAAAAVFASTALLQSGRLEGLLVLATQMRLTWRIARIYHAKPQLPELLRLYAHIGTNVLIAEQIQDSDFAEMAGALVTMTAPGVLSAIPGVQAVTGPLIKSLIGGTANAYLTLRVGILTRSFCRARTQPDEAALRRSASLEAFALAKALAMDQGGRLAKSTLNAAGSAVARTVDATVEGVKSVANKTSTLAIDGARSVGGGMEKGWKRMTGARSDAPKDSLPSPPTENPGSTSGQD